LDPWLAPEPVRVLPVGESHSASAHELAHLLDSAGLRVGVDAGPDTLARRVLRAHADSAPFALILGDREIAAGAATIRERGGQNQTLGQAEAAHFLVHHCRPPL
jgi:threonyl-tRNA synthetase